MVNEEVNSLMIKYFSKKYKSLCPVIYGVRNKNSLNENEIHAWCVFCRKYHIHSKYDGHRTAHCSKNHVDSSSWTGWNNAGYIGFNPYETYGYQLVGTDDQLQKNTNIIKDTIKCQWLDKVEIKEFYKELMNEYKFGYYENKVPVYLSNKFEINPILLNQEGLIYEYFQILYKNSQIGWNLVRDNLMLLQEISKN